MVRFALSKEHNVPIPGATAMLAVPHAADSHVRLSVSRIAENVDDVNLLKWLKQGTTLIIC